MNVIVLAYGLGPQQIIMNGHKTSPRAELKEFYSAIEESKAGVTGVFALQYLLDQQSRGKIPAGTINITERQLYTTYFTLMFRSMRFGTNEAHGLVQFNYLLDKGAIAIREDGMFMLVWDKIKSAIRDLDHDLLMLEATGNYAGAKELLATKGIIKPELAEVILKLANIPTDIEPIFITAKKLVPEVIASGAEFENSVLQKNASSFFKIDSPHTQQSEQKSKEMNKDQM